MKPLLVLACLLSSTPALAAPEKVAVLVLGTAEPDAELADNVTEVVIASVARKGGFEITGREEFRARLGLESERRALTCLEDISCLGRTAVSLGVRRIVAGTVGTRGKQFLFNLNLNNVESGKVEHRVFRLVDGSIQDLIRAVEIGAAELFQPKIEPGRIEVMSEPAGARVSIDNAYLGVTPLISGTLLPGQHRVRVEAEGRFPWISSVEVLPGQDLGIELTEQNLPGRRRWPTYAAWTTGGLAAAAAATGGFLGVLSRINTTGDTRAEHQNDFRQKQDLARGANVAFLSAGVLALTSLTLTLIYRDDVFGRRGD